MRSVRVFHILLLFTVAFAALGLRLVWVQTAAGAELAKSAAASVRQRQVHVMLNDGRGNLVDRNGMRLTGASEDALLMLPGGLDILSPSERQRIADTLRMTEAKLLSIWPKAGEMPKWWGLAGASSEPVPLAVWQVEALRSIPSSAYVIADKTIRYPGDRIAAHLVGFTAEQPDRFKALYTDHAAIGSLPVSTPIGASGLELAFDRFLLGTGREFIAYHIDGRGQPLTGLGIRHIRRDNPYYPLQAVTTIDAALQRSLEELADRYPLQEGAVVVLDAVNADVLAMVSRPNYQAGQIPQHSADWQNRALSSIPPGSVMKTFIAAVALETGAVSPNETFICDGTYHKYGLTCWKEGGHGRLSFAEALAQSCNLVFAEVGERLDAFTLQQYAERLGLSGKIGWQGVSLIDGLEIRQFPEEQSNTIFGIDMSEVDGGVLAQTAIGQRDVSWTPLAAANWTITLLNGGAVAFPRAVSKLNYADGHAMEKYELQREKARALSPRTVYTLRGMMEEVAATGTGQSLAAAKWRLAGKSGTAETVKEGVPAVHQWFVGYGPAELPRYAVAVVANYRPPGSKNLATAIFKDVMDLLAAYESQ